MTGHTPHIARAAAIATIVALLALLRSRIQRGRRMLGAPLATALAARPHASTARPLAAPPAPTDRPAPPRPPRPRRNRSITTKVALTAASLALAATGAIGGSYAAWTASTVNPAQSVTAGLLTLENDKANTSLFTATNVRPGMSSSSTVVISNKAGANQLPMLATLSQQNVATTLSSSLRWTLHDQTRNWCYWPVNQAGACPAVLTAGGAWNASATMTDLGLRPIGGLPTDPWPAGESHTFVVEWALGAESPNADQGKTASFDLAWSGSQVPA